MGIVASRGVARDLPFAIPGKSTKKAIIAYRGTKGGGKEEFARKNGLTWSAIVRGYLANS